MKKLTITLCLAAIFVAPLFAQDPCSQSTKLSNPARTITSNGTGNLSGSGSTQMHYEMWTEGGNNNKMMWFGADKGGGAAFRAEWNSPNDFLGRIGYYWGDGGKYTQYKNIYTDFNFTRSGRSTAGDYSYIGIYGWTKNPLVEYYVVEDWFGNQWQADTSPITTNTTSGTVQGTFTVDGSTYQVVKNTRTGPSINGNTTFSQYFSIRQTQRKCGTISLTEHFKQWEKMGMSMGNMYEAKFLVEAGGGTGWFDASYIKFSQEDQPRGSTGGTSSNSTGGTASSSSSRAQATTCKTPLIAYPTNTVPSDPYTACFKHTNGKCYVCKVSSETTENTCASGWVWNNVTNVDDNLSKNLWYQEVTCPATSSSSVASSSSRAVSSSSVASSSSRAVSSSSVASSSSRAVSSSSVASSSSSSVTITCTGLQATVEKGGTIVAPTITCSDGSRATNPTWSGRPAQNTSWTPTSDATSYNIGVSAVLCGSTSLSNLTVVCGTVTVITPASSSSNATAGTSSSSSAENVSSSSEDPTPILGNRVPVTYFSIQPQSDNSLRIEVSSPAVVEIFNLKGNKVTSLNVSGSQTVKLALPNGVYFAKAHGTKSIRFVLK